MHSTDILLKKKLEDIGEFFLSRQYMRNPRLHSVGLLSGLTSVLLILSEFYRRTRDQRYKEEFGYCLEQIIERVDNTPVMLFTFCDGLAGLGWAFNYLKNQVPEMDIEEFIELDDFLEEVDAGLSAPLATILGEQDFDLMHGAMGIGLYLLSRNKTSEVEKIIHVLYAKRDEEIDEIRWSRYDKYTTKADVYDLGLAHGNAGTLYFLGKCYQKGVCKDLCKTLILGSIRFYRNNVQNPRIVGSYFHYSILKDKYRYKDNEPAFSRLAWCYGDIGIMHTILLVSKWVGLEEEREWIQKSMFGTIGRKTEENTMLHDSQFCHGMAGVGYLCLSLYNETGEPAFSEAAAYWLEKVLQDGRDNSKGTAGFIFEMGENVGWLEMIDLLSGLAGVSMFLLSVQNSLKKTALDECFFLS